MLGPLYPDGDKFSVDPEFDVVQTGWLPGVQQETFSTTCTVHIKDCDG